MRFLALLVSLLALVAQPRVVAPVPISQAPVVRLVAERAQHIESAVLRAEVAVRVAAAPVFPRLPWFCTDALRWRSPSVRFSFEPDGAGQLRLGVTHFHSKRRIPRMNSEEPPRA